MESRSIDTAQNASIDLMTLNKKVVNMRATVKRAKVHVINKLTRNIADLKKKKGSEEEKEKNLKKAQRYLDDIQSIRSLKEDKITKYSIANVYTFEEVSKTTLSSGARALARLADQRFIKDAVSKFRDEHSDWKDLAAFMLMQQTGRKFKSVKKDKKLASKRVENINASKLMTQAYTEGLFREEGPALEKQKSEKIRKKTIEKENKDVDKIVNTDGIKKENNIPGDKESSNESGSQEKSLQKTMLDIASKNKESIDDNKDKSKKIQQNAKSIATGGKRAAEKESKVPAKKQKLDESYQSVFNEDKLSDSEEEDDVSEVSGNEEEVKEQDEEEVKEQDEEEGTEEEEGASDGDSDDNAEENSDNNQEELEADDSSEDNDQDQPLLESSKYSVKNINIKNKEMVVKQFDIGSDGAESDSDEEVISSSEEEDAEESEEEEIETKSKKGKRGSKTVPDFVTAGEDKPNKLPRDPFFEGDDYDDYYATSYQEDYTQSYEDGDDSEIHEKFSGNKRTTKSLFYQPGDERREQQRREVSGGRGRGSFRGREGGFDRNRGGSFGDRRGRGRGGFVGERGRGFGSDRGRGFGGRGRGSFRGDRGRGFGGDRGRGFGGDRGRGRFDRGGFGGDRGRGSFRGANSSKFEGRQGNKEFHNTARSQHSVPSKEKSVPNKSTLPEKLHPSWEASRKKRAEQSGGIKAFAGTKITFDD